MPVPSGRHSFAFVPILLMLGTLLACVHPAAAALGDREGVIVVVMDQQHLPYQEVVDGFGDRLSKANSQVRLDKIYLSRDAQEQAGTLNRLRESRPQLILVLGSVALDAVSETIHDIPILFGLVFSEDRQHLPDNVSGVYLDFPLEIQFGWLRRVLPEARTVGVVYNRPQNQGTVANAERVARTLGLRLVGYTVDSPQELPAALDALASSADVFWGITDRVVVTPQTARTLLLFSFRNRIPFFGLSETWVKAGALMALDRDYPDIGRQCANQAIKILQGGTVKSVPPEPPRRALLFLNRHIAEQMKLPLSAELLETAAKVY